jgi:hypothetical protein
MKKFLSLGLLGLCSCGTAQEINGLISQSTDSVYRNADAIQRSTEAVRRNGELVDASNRTIAENRALLEEASKN